MCLHEDIFYELYYNKRFSNYAACARVVEIPWPFVIRRIFAVRRRCDSHPSYSLFHFRSYRAEKAIIRNEAHFIFKERHLKLRASRLGTYILPAEVYPMYIHRCMCLITSDYGILSTGHLNEWNFMQQLEG